MTTRSKTELKSMIMQFRVAELQSLLDFAGESNTRLRKKELQKKASRLISKKFTVAIGQKVRSIYKGMLGNISDDDYFPSDLEDCNSEDFESTQSYDYVFNYLSDCSSRVPSVNYYNNARQNNQYFAMFTKNLDMTRISHVRFSNISFFDYKSDILIVTPLVPKKQDGDSFTFDITFFLEHQASSALFAEGSRYHAFLRLGVLSNELQVTDQHPAMLSVKVNHNYCTLPSITSILTKTNPAKKFCPIDITSYLEKNKYINSLAIEWPVDYFTMYGVVIQLLYKYTADELICKLKERGERDPSVSKKFIYDSLNDDEDEIAATSLKMSLTCPLGKMRMTLPTRATTCNHLQCFDGYLYIKMNEVKSAWQCPVCCQTCIFENLFIDGYFMDVLRSDKFLSSVTNIQVNSDGSWEPVVEKEKARIRARIEPVSEPEIPKKVAKKTKEEPLCNPPPPIMSYNTSSSSTNIIDDLKDFFLTYNNPTMSTVNPEPRSSASMLPCYDIAADDNFNNMNPINDRELSTLSPSSNANTSKKKNIVLVDLTLSDSDTDDDIESVQSVSSSSASDGGSSSPVCIDNDSSSDISSASPVPPPSPPVYDIDSDSSF